MERKLISKLKEILGAVDVCPEAHSREVLDFIDAAPEKVRIDLMQFLLENFQSIKLPESNYRVKEKGLSKEKRRYLQEKFNPGLVRNLSVLVNEKEVDSFVLASKIMEMIEIPKDEDEKIFVMAKVMYGGVCPYYFEKGSTTISQEDVKNLIEKPSIVNVAAAVLQHGIRFRTMADRASFILDIIEKAENSAERVAIVTAILLSIETAFPVPNQPLLGLVFEMGNQCEKHRPFKSHSNSTVH